jgi:hypothetical protein
VSVRWNPGALGVGGAGGSLAQAYTNNSGSPGNTTINTPSGRAAIAIGATTCVVTNSTVTASSKVLVDLETTDTGVLYIRATPAAGSFTVTGGPAVAAVACTFSFLVVN